MSLYYETAPFLRTDGTSGSLKSRIFSADSTKSPHNQIFALASETSKWSLILSDVIERAQLLQNTRKLTPDLAILLVHDLLLTKRGISAPANHPLRLAVEKQKARLAAEFTRARLRRGCASLDDLRRLVNEESVISRDAARQDGNVTNESNASVCNDWPQPRWVRVNTLKTTLEEQMSTTFAAYESTPTLDELLSTTGRSIEVQLIHIDKHVPNLLALPPRINLSKTNAYLDGLIILQDKASCFPAYLLDADSSDDCLDTCAAPGNKTTHLAAILHEKGRDLRRPGTSLDASERDPKRASVLDAMLAKAGASSLVRVHRQDFLSFDPTKSPFNTFSALLLDPSCSGSGILSRDQTYKVTLPSEFATPESQTGSKRKRKRTKVVVSSETSIATAVEEVPLAPDEPTESLRKRLTSLSDFQTRLLIHAFSFPSAHKITYSTCSVYADENENVVIKALLHSHKKALGWRILPRNEQVQGMQAWHLRGDLQACSKLLLNNDLDATEIADACIRCEKGTKEGTQGFFVAAFVRRLDANVLQRQEDEEEWGGFADE